MARLRHTTRASISSARLTTTRNCASAYSKCACLIHEYAPVMDAGSLRRAHELEAVGFLQMTLAAAEKIGWTGGFATVR